MAHPKHLSLMIDYKGICHFRPEVKEGKEGETEKTAEQENNESDKIEKELEKDKVGLKVEESNTKNCI